MIPKTKEKKRSKSREPVPKVIHEKQVPLPVEDNRSVHKFDASYAVSPVWCAVCETFIFGLTRKQQDCLVCARCGITIHGRCIDDLHGPCLSKTFSEVAQKDYHFESAQPGQCSSYLLVRSTSGNAKRWVKLTEKRTICIYQTRDDAVPIEELQIIDSTQVVYLEPTVIRSASGFELVFAGILNSRVAFYSDPSDISQNWYHHVQLAIKIARQVIEEEETEFYWGDLTAKYYTNKRAKSGAAKPKRSQTGGEDSTSSEGVKIVIVESEVKKKVIEGKEEVNKEEIVEKTVKMEFTLIEKEQSIQNIETEKKEKEEIPSEPPKEPESGVNPQETVPEIVSTEISPQKKRNSKHKPSTKAVKSRKGISESRDIKDSLFFRSQEEIILYQKIVNRSCTSEDLKHLEDEIIEKYLPIFLQMPQVMDGVLSRISNPRIQQTAYWCFKAQLKMANCYLQNIDWLGDTTKLDRTWQFFKDLVTEFPLKEGARYENLDLFDPLWKAGTISTVLVKKIFKSAHSPCLLQLIYSDPNILPCRVVFKDDDVRPDMMASVIFGVFNTLWKSSGIGSKPELVHFKVVPLGPHFGFLEFMENSITLRDYNLGAVTSFTDDQMDRFLATTAAGYVGGFLLGIRDRHEENLMIMNNTDFFQLDFGFMFNNKTRGIDGCRFAVSRRLKAAMESQNIQFSRWQNFKDRSAACYLVLRRNSHVIVQLCRILFNDMFPGSQIEMEVIRGFYLDRTEDEAVQHIQELIEMGVVSVKRLMKNVTHEIYQKVVV